MADFKRALEVCRGRPGYGGDFLRAVAWVDANSFAVHVKGDRGAFNDQMASSRVDVMFRDVDFAGLLEGALPPGP